MEAVLVSRMCTSGTVKIPRGVEGIRPAVCSKGRDCHASSSSYERQAAAYSCTPICRPSRLIVGFFSPLLKLQVLEDPAAFDEAVLKAHMWGALRAQMEPHEAEILDKVICAGGKRRVGVGTGGVEQGQQDASENRGREGEGEGAKKGVSEAGEEERSGGQGEGCEDGEGGGI